MIAQTSSGSFDSPSSRKPGLRLAQDDRSGMADGLGLTNTFQYDIVNSVYTVPAMHRGKVNLRRNGRMPSLCAERVFGIQALGSIGIPLGTPWDTLGTNWDEWGLG